jgi:lipoprotein signal peptidase
VRDFIAVGNFPVFNFADAFLTIAVILVCIRQIFPCKTKVES